MKTGNNLTDEWETLSLCKSCNCMTKTLAGKCGKCGALKTKTKSELENNDIEYLESLLRSWISQPSVLEKVLELINANYVPISEVEERVESKMRYRLAQLDWIMILHNAIESRPTSWREDPVYEYRNASDEIWLQVHKEMGLSLFSEKQLKKLKKLKRFLDNTNEDINKT